MVDNPIGNLIREAKIHQIPGMLEVGKKKGNVPLDDAIMDLLNAGKISGDEAFDKAINKKRFRPYLSREPNLGKSSGRVRHALRLDRPSLFF